MITNSKNKIVFPKKVAKLIYKIYNNFWVEFIGRIIIYITIIYCMLSVVVGPEIEDEGFQKIDDKITIILCVVLLSLWLLYKWAKHQIKDELKEEGLIDEEED